MISSDILPLSEAQMGIWLGQQKLGEHPAYNTGEFISLRFPVDKDKLQKVICEVIEETDSLSSSFFLEDGIPKQRVHRSLKADVFYLDYTDSGDYSFELALQWMKKSLATPLDIENERPYVTAIIKLAEDHYIWFIQTHHIVMDGFAYSLFYQRVAKIYSDGRSYPDYLPIPKLAQYIYEDITYQSSDKKIKDKEFWEAYLSGYSWKSSLSGAPIETYGKVVRLESELDQQLTKLLAKFCTENKCRWLDTMSAIVFVFWYYHTGHRDISLALPVMNRIGTKSLRIPCMKMNIVPFRVLVQKDMSLLDLIIEVKKQLKLIRPYLNYRYEHMKKDRSDKGYDQHIFSAVLNVMPFDNEPIFDSHPGKVERLSAGPVEDIAFNFVPKGDKGDLTLTLEANANIYTKEQLKSYYETFMEIAKALFTDTSVKIDQIPGNVSIIEGDHFRNPQYSNVVQVLKAQVTQYPESTAIQNGQIDLSYKAMYTKIEKLAMNLKGLKASDGGEPQRVVIFMSRSIDTILLIWACIRSEITYSMVDPQGPQNRNHFIIDNFQPDWVIYDSESCPDIDIPQIQIESLNSMDQKNALISEDALNTNHIVYVCYTSGSTGTPKGVAIQLRNLSAFVRFSQDVYKVRNDDRVLQFAPLHFDASVEEIFLSHCYGAKLVLRNEACLESMDQFVEFCESHKITLLDLPTAFWHELVIDLYSRKERLPKDLERCIIGGEKAQGHIIEQWHSLSEDKVKLFDTYGPTETTVVATTAEISKHSKASIGKPLLHLTALVMDAAGTPVKRGQIGELWILGDNVGKGYWNLESHSSRQNFTQLQLKAEGNDFEGPCYRTGDLVRINQDHNIEYIGRKDDEIKISGHRISLVEIEDALLKCSGIKQAAVISFKHLDNPFIAAFYVGQKSIIDASDLKNSLKKYLPAVMIPRLFIGLDSLPINQNGKLAKKELLNEARTALEKTDNNDLNNVLSAEEITVKRVVEDVLQISINDREQDLFDAGAQSLQMIKLASRISRYFKINMKVADAFSHASLKEITDFIDKSKKGRQKQIKENWPVLKRTLESESTSFSISEKVSAAKDHYRNKKQLILVTGVTGFLGRYLLADLLAASDHDIIVLVRAQNDLAAQERVREKFAEMSDLSLPCLWENHRDRLQIWSADLTAEKFGLSLERYQFLQQSCTSIIHNAAAVSVTRSYDSLKSDNVEATRKLLFLAAEGFKKAFTYISTIATAQLLESGSLLEDYTEIHQGLGDGYRQTKWVAESFVETAAKEGLHTQTIRLGRITGSLASSYVNTKDLMWQILAACCRLKSYPKLSLSEPWTPVDYTAEIINKLHALLSKSQDAMADPKPSLYHLLPRKAVDVQQLFSWLKDMDYCHNAMDVKDWVAALEARGGDEDLKLLSFFAANEASGDHKRISFNGSEGKLCKEIGYEPGPNLSKDLFCKYLDYAKSAGFIEQQRQISN